jgi:hypothetical protein
MSITKIQSESLNLSDTYAFTGTVTGAGGIMTPAFNVYISSGYTVSDNTLTKVQFNTEILDTDSKFDLSNYRFTPTIAGKYFLIMTLYSDAGAVGIVNNVNSLIYKNGSAITGARAILDFRNNPGVSACATVSTIATLDTDDYIEFYGSVDVTSGTCYHKDQSHAVGYKIIE